MSVAIAHSMRGDTDTATWPQLRADEVRRVLELWNIPAAQAHIAWHSPRPLSAAAIVTLPGGSLFIKRHSRQVREAAHLEEEHRFSAHLLSRGIGVTRVLHSAHGPSALSVGEWSYEVHELGAGVDLYCAAVSWTPFSSHAHATAAGRALATLHIASGSYFASPRLAHLLVSNDSVIRSADPVEAVERATEARPALREYLRRHRWREELTRALAPFHERYLKLSSSLAPLWTHNDWHASNLLWSDASPTAEVRTILDFGLSDRTTAVYDLATAIERNTIPWLDIQAGRSAAADFDLVDALLRGYLAGTQLGILERAALVAILPIVHVGYALTEIDYFYGITRSSENADLAYGAFLLGHCHWFERAEGQALLAHIHQQLQTIP
ncbi:MAG: aminoglycoside phosphotransferase family protein [Steroidobacteraceae bacterium]